MDVFTVYGMHISYICINIYIYIHIQATCIYMGSGRFPGPMELLLQQLVRVSKTR